MGRLGTPDPVVPDGAGSTPRLGQELFVPVRGRDGTAGGDVRVRAGAGGDETEVRVVDSNSKLRFLMIPRRPEGLDGWIVEVLAELVNRNSMIGVAAATGPGTD